MVHTDTAHRKAFRRAIFRICGSETPSRACLADIGRRASVVARRARPWSARHVWVCLHLERYLHHNDGAVKYGIHPRLFDAVMKLDDIAAWNGKRPTLVYARAVREGAVVLGRSRRCAWRRCRVHFVGDAHRKYCSEQCGKFAHAERQKQAAKKRHERARRLTARKRSEKRRGNR